MLETISSINSTVNGIVWGVPAMVLIFGVGLYLSIRTGFLQFRKFGTVWQNTIGKLFHRSTEAGRGAVTPFQAVCTALAATVGHRAISPVCRRYRHRRPRRCFLDVDLRPAGYGDQVQRGYAGRPLPPEE